MPNRLVQTIALVLAISACSPDLTGSGRAIYARNCAQCHGATAAGDGAAGADLPVPPSDLRYLAAANDGVFPTEEVMATIYGYSGKDAAALMPEFGPLLDGPKVLWTAPDGTEIPTPKALVDLTTYLETLQRP